MSNLPLFGIRIIAVEQYGAAPFGTSHLADMGAEIIKIENPNGGDSSRRSGPHFIGDNDSHFFQTFNRSKKSMTLNLKQPEGKIIFQKLVESSEAVINNLRGDLPEKLGLTFDSLKAWKPSITCVHLSGYGRTGERASWPAYDYLMQAEAGHMSLTGEPDGSPTRMGLSMIDYVSGVTASFALLSSIISALKTGEGRDVDVSLYDVAMYQLTYPAAWYLNAGDQVDRRPRSGHPSVSPCEMFPTKDGFLFVMCILPKFWENFCDLLNLSFLKGDEKFLSNEDRFKNRSDLITILDETLLKETTAFWFRRLSGKVPVAPVLNVKQALENDFLNERRSIDRVNHPDSDQPLKFISSPIKLNGVRPSSKAAPKLGQDTEELLTELGFTASQISNFKSSGAV